MGIQLFNCNNSFNTICLTKNNLHRCFCRCYTTFGRDTIIAYELPLIHPTQNHHPLHVCFRFISNDLTYTNLGSLKLIIVSNQPEKRSLRCILFNGCYVGWMRNTLTYNNSLAPNICSWNHVDCEFHVMNFKCQHGMRRRIMELKTLSIHGPS